MHSRRHFLTRSSLLALAPTVPGFLARTARATSPGRDDRVLVVVELNGGNDGINTVVPYADEGYTKHRKSLRLPKDRLVQLNDQIGLHPSLKDAGTLLDSGQLTIVQGVGYPNPSRSHFQSMATWHTARLDPEEHSGPGWLGRGLDSGNTAGSSLFVGSDQPPVAIRGRRSSVAAIERLEDFTLESNHRSIASSGTQQPSNDASAFVERSLLDAYATASQMRQLAGRANDTRYPETKLADRLRLIAQLMKGGSESRVFYTVQSGYDTHNAQLQTHGNLLRELSGALKAFLDDLTTTKLADRVVILVFSEFGRTVAENGSAGTDHGTSGPVFLAGPNVRGGLVGATPSLLELDPKNGDLKTAIDFRRIYGTLLEQWLGLPAHAALGGDFGKLPVIRG
jgi:uncharacterized protein (DUF1501 family)